MGLIHNKWNSEECRIEDGIFFGSDEYIPVQGTPETGYNVGERRNVSDIINADPSAWCNLIQTVMSHFESCNLSIYAGETSWEGEGFLAVATPSTSQLLWLLHLSTSEPFTEVAIDGDIICAKSGGYPMRFDWRIPIHTPERLTVKNYRVI